MDVGQVCAELPAIDVVEALILILSGLLDNMPAVEVDAILQRVGQLAAERIRPVGPAGGSRP